MRALCLALALIAASAAHAGAQAVPVITRPVVDQASLLRPSTVSAIEQRLLAHREAGHAQIAVLIVPSIGSEPVADYAMRVAEAWSGGSRDADDGVLFVMAMESHDMRIEAGYGVEAVLPDSVAMQLLDAAIPTLRAGDFDRAVWDIVDGIVVRTGGAHAEPPAGEVGASPFGATPQYESPPFAQGSPEPYGGTPTFPMAQPPRRDTAWLGALALLCAGGFGVFLVIGVLLAFLRGLSAFARTFGGPTYGPSMRGPRLKRSGPPTWKPSSFEPSKPSHKSSSKPSSFFGGSSSKPSSSMFGGSRSKPSFGGSSSKPSRSWGGGGGGFGGGGASKKW